MTKLIDKFHAIDINVVEINNVQYYIQIFYYGLKADSFKVKTSYFGDPIFECKSVEELEKYLNNLSK